MCKYNARLAGQLSQGVPFGGGRGFMLALDTTLKHWKLGIACCIKNDDVVQILNKFSLIPFSNC